MINKIVPSMAEAVAGVKDGMTILLGGFGSVGQPNHLVQGVIDGGARDLVVVANNAGGGHVGLALLMELGRVRKIICSFPRSSTSTIFEELYRVLPAIVVCHRTWEHHSDLALIGRTGLYISRCEAFGEKFFE